jgi:hypothetical protein
MRAKRLIEAVAAETAAMPNSVAWAQILCQLQDRGCTARAAHLLRETVWAARKVRKASIPVQ